MLLIWDQSREDVIRWPAGRIQLLSTRPKRRSSNANMVRQSLLKQSPALGWFCDTMDVVPRHDANPLLGRKNAEGQTDRPCSVEGSFDSHDWDFLRND